MMHGMLFAFIFLLLKSPSILLETERRCLEEKAETFLKEDF